MWLMRTFILLSFLLAAVGVASVTGPAVELCNADFDRHNQASWIDELNLRPSVVSERGNNALRLTFTGKAVDYLALGLTLPGCKKDEKRYLHYSFKVKSSGVKPGQLVMRMLNFYAPGKAPVWYQGKEDFCVLPTSSQYETVAGWVTVDDAAQRGFNLYIAGKSAAGTVWLDDVKVESSMAAPKELWKVTFQGDRILAGETVRNVFTADAAGLPVEITAAERLKKVTCEVVDDMGGPARVEVHSAPVAMPLLVNLPERGFYTVTVEAEYQDGYIVKAGTTACVTGPLIPDNLRMKSKFGLSNAELPGYYLAAGARFDRRFRAPARDEYKAAADGNYKQDIPLANPHDDLVPMTSIYCLWPQPYWLQELRPDEGVPTYSEAMYPIRDLPAFERHINYVLKHLSNVPVEYVEVCNEPEQGHWRRTEAEFVQYCRVLKKAVKRTDPGIKLIGPSYCTVEIPNFTRLHQLGLFEVIDGLAIHNYVRATAPEEDFYERILSLKQFMRSINKSHLPIFITEFGWTIPPGDWQTPVTPLVQAQYLSRAVILLTAEEAITGFQWYSMWSWDNSHGYALLKKDDRTPRLGFAAYATAARCLAGVGGRGKILNLSPTTYLALFYNGGETVAALWDKAGRSQAFLPEKVVELRGMTGRPLPVAEDGIVAVSQSPVYAKVTGKKLYDIKVVDTRKARLGGSTTLPFDPLWLPPGLSAKDRVLTVSSAVTPGLYTVFGRNAKGENVCCGVDAYAMLTLESAVVNQWPADRAAPVLTLALKSALPEQTDLNCQIEFAGVNHLLSQVIPMASGEVKKLDVTLPPLGRDHYRYQGRVTVTPPGKTTACSVDFNCTAIPCRRLENGDWTRNSPAIKGMFVSDQDVRDMDVEWRAAYDAGGLRLEIKVKDPVHTQHAVPKEMWSQDSVQIGIDADAALPWRPNVPGSWNGHFRLFEYGFSLTEQRRVETWRWGSHFAALPGDMAEPRVKAKVTRRNGIFLYDIKFPWNTLGLETVPAPGTPINLAMVVNDAGANGRRILTCFDGIAHEKNPSAYGTIWLR